MHLLRNLDESELHGRGRDPPVLGVLVVVGGLGLAGLPPFGLFRGEALMEPAGCSARAVALPPRTPENGAFVRSGLGVAWACAVAAFALWPPKKRGLGGKCLAVLYRPLGRLHSGHLGDYVAWLLLGVAGHSTALFRLGGFGH